MEYAAAEIEDVPPAKDDRNAAWDAFGDADADPCSSSPNVFDAAYWNGVLAALGCSVADGGDLGVGVAAVDAPVAFAPRRTEYQCVQIGRRE